MALFQSDNSPQTLTFTLASALAKVAYFRSATTLSFAGGRPLVTVNSFSCGTPAAPTTIDSRGVTRGAYRGWGDVYTCTIPAGTLVAGTNTITISIASGSSGATFLSPNVVSFDSSPESSGDAGGVLALANLVTRFSMRLSCTIRHSPRADQYFVANLSLQPFNSLMSYDCTSCLAGKFVHSM